MDILYRYYVLSNQKIAHYHDAHGEIKLLNLTLILRDDIYLSHDVHVFQTYYGYNYAPQI